MRRRTGNAIAEWAPLGDVQGPEHPVIHRQKHPEIAKIPAVAAMIAVNGITRRIIFGWLFGVTGCFGGLELSMRLDLSSGPTIVAVFLVLLTGTWATKKMLT